PSLVFTPMAPGPTYLEKLSTYRSRLGRAPAAVRWPCDEQPTTAKPLPELEGTSGVDLVNRVGADSPQKIDLAARRKLTWEVCHDSKQDNQGSCRHPEVGAEAWRSSDQRYWNRTRQGVGRRFTVRFRGQG